MCAGRSMAKIFNLTLEPRLGQTGFLLIFLCGRAKLPTHPFILVKVLSLCGFYVQWFPSWQRPRVLSSVNQLGETSVPNALDSCYWHLSPEHFQLFMFSFLLYFQLLYYYCYHYFLPLGIFSRLSFQISNAFEKYDFSNLSSIYFFLMQQFGVVGSEY